MVQNENCPLENDNHFSQNEHHFSVNDNHFCQVQNHFPSSRITFARPRLFFARSRITFPRMMITSSENHSCKTPREQSGQSTTCKLGVARCAQPTHPPRPMKSLRSDMWFAAHGGAPGQAVHPAQKKLFHLMVAQIFHVPGSGSQAADLGK